MPKHREWYYIYHHIGYDVENAIGKIKFVLRVSTPAISLHCSRCIPEFGRRRARECDDEEVCCRVAHNDKHYRIHHPFCDVSLIESKI